VILKLIAQGKSSLHQPKNKSLKMMRKQRNNSLQKQLWKPTNLKRLRLLSKMILEIPITSKMKLSNSSQCFSLN
jgi:hypothetical protein